MKRWTVEEPVEAARVVAALVETARPIVLERYRPDSCIASTMIAIDALEFFGVAARPRPVRVTVVSPRLAEALAANDPRAHDPKASRWPFRWYAVGVGFDANGESGVRESGDGYVGHLVAEVPVVGLFVDLSIDQASRPDRGVVLEPKAFASFWPAPGGEYEINGTHLIYEAFEDRSFESAKDYRLRNRRRPTTGAVVRAIRARLLETTEVDGDGNSDRPR